MLISLTAEQEAWLKARVATGEVASIEEAARRVIDDRIAEERRLGARSRREVLLAGELSDADVAEIAATKMDPRHNHLNNELT
ncbi:MAG TPA: hypothetical protein VK148_17095 [Xanthobacteraceae bacterium]|nr:hypothetical protein [Xanthobacteraceae bacterium]